LLGVIPSKIVEASPQFYVTAPNSIIQSYGTKPPASGIFHTWRRIKILENGSLERELLVTWLGDRQLLPPIGATCTITYHSAYVAGYAEPAIETGKAADVLDDFKCNDARH
jgi:hypothetical protein